MRPTTMSMSSISTGNGGEAKMADIKDKLAESKVREAEAKIATQKIRRDAAYRRLVAGQKSGASPDTRARFAALYDRAEERLEEAEDAAREAKRKAMGLGGRERMLSEMRASTEAMRARYDLPIAGERAVPIALGGYDPDADLEALALRWQQPIRS